MRSYNKKKPKGEVKILEISRLRPNQLYCSLNSSPTLPLNNKGREQSIDL
jgi:hypothetical protein